MRLFDSSLTDFDRLAKDFRWEIPAQFNIATAVCDRHAASGSVAMWYEDELGNSASFSFADIQRLSNQLANLLQSLDVKRGDRVAMILPQRVETAIGHIAAHKLGAVSLPLSVLFGVDALEHRLKDSGATLVITLPAQAERIAGLFDRLPDLAHILVCSSRSAGLENSGPESSQRQDHKHIKEYPRGCLDLFDAMASQSDEFVTAITSADDAACLIYTSGTTGPPKGALIAHRSLLGNLTGFELSLNFFPQSGDVFFTPADWAWTGGLFDGLLPTWFYGMPIVGFEGRKFDPVRMFALLEKYSVTCGFFPPTALKMMRTVDSASSEHLLKLRAIMSAGEMLGEELLDWAREELGVVINEMYGQTEQNYMVGNCSAIMPPKPGSMGKAYPGHRVEVMNSQGEICATGETGEFVAHSDDAVHFLGYWKQPEATARKYTDKWFHTGDVGYRDEDDYLWFVGRSDDVITSAGYRIGPGEIEDCILKHPSVLQVAVVGVPDPQGIRGDIVKAFVVTRENVSATEELAEEIRLAVRDELAAYEYPRELEFIDELPMTTTGKVRRIELREREIVQRSDGKP